MTVRLLAPWTHAKKVESMRHCFETVGASDALLQLGRETLVDLDHRGTFHADQMMMMPRVILRHQLESVAAIAKVEPADHAHLFQEMHRTIDRRKVAIFAAQAGEEFFNAQRLGVASQYLQNRQPLARNLAGTAS
jgi:hypothetical protein